MKKDHTNNNGNSYFKFPETFTYLTITFTIKLLSDLYSPYYKGSLFRGMIGKAIHDMSCQFYNEDCKNCEKRLTCAYPNLFKPEYITEVNFTIPPFVIFSPSYGKRYYKNDLLEFSITLFGDFIEYYDYFIKAVNYSSEKLGLGHNKTKFKIQEIRKEKNILYRDGFIKKSSFSIDSLSDIKEIKNKNVISVKFLSPVKIKREKKILYNPSFEDIINESIRRIKIINKAIWQDETFSLNKLEFSSIKYNLLKYEIKFVKEFKSKGLGTEVDLSGFVGKIKVFCADNINKLYALLKAAEITHIGKSGSYGLGKLKVEAENIDKF